MNLSNKSLVTTAETIRHQVDYETSISQPGNQSKYNVNLNRY